MTRNGAKMGRVWYCGYCYAAVFGTPDATWLPTLARRERIGRGFHDEN